MCLIVASNSFYKQNKHARAKVAAIHSNCRFAALQKGILLKASCIPEASRVLWLWIGISVVVTLHTYYRKSIVEGES